MISKKYQNLRRELSDYFAVRGFSQFAHDVLACPDTSLPFYYKKYAEEHPPDMTGFVETRTREEA